LNHLGVSTTALEKLFHNPNLTGGAGACVPPPPVTDDILDGLPCSAGHTACYISPHGELWPCVQFPVVCGDLRQSRFAEIWKHSSRLAEIRSIRARDLTTCSGCGHIGTCSRCPGLAYMEGSMYGPSSADCEKSFARTGIPSANMPRTSSATLVQISL
jgi:radical SAM protein with 4Fe4S-binding SPASM domain